MEGDEHSPSEASPVSTTFQRGPGSSAARDLRLAQGNVGGKAALAMQTARKWAFAAIPAIGVLELGAHVVQTHSAVPESDWKSAREYVTTASQPDDLVTFAPRWVDPIGRQEFGPEVATLEREARPDESRFPRAFEVAVHGAHDVTLEGWRRVEQRDFGRVTVTTLVNPSPVRVLDDLVSLVSAQRLRVSRIEGDHAVDCPFGHGGAQSGGLGAGPAVPGDRFVCPGGNFVGASVAADLTYRARRCIYAPPPGGRTALRLEFVGVQIGKALHGHHGLYVEAERSRTGAPVTITFKIGDATVGSVVHNDGDGWKPFEFDTTSFQSAPQGRANLVAEIGERRMYCFEADTR